MYSKLQDGNFIVCGFVARNAELKTVGEKKSSLCRWSVRAGEKGSGDNKQAIWVNCQAWHDKARSASAIQKGDTVLCVGRLEKSTGADGREYKNLVCEFISVMKAVPKESGVVLSPEGESELADLSGYEEILSDGEVPF
ncbi:MAG: single-stranded DNA-binding protein [Porcipelethomonas sp.]